MNFMRLSELLATFGSLLVIVLATLGSKLFARPAVDLKKYRRLETLWNNSWLRVPVGLVSAVVLIVWGDILTNFIKDTVCKLPLPGCLMPANTRGSMLDELAPNSEWNGLWAGRTDYQARNEKSDAPHIAGLLFMDLSVDGTKVTAKEVRHILNTALYGRGAGTLTGSDFQLTEEIITGTDQKYSVRYHGFLSEYEHSIDGQWETDWGDRGIFTLNFSK